MDALTGTSTALSANFITSLTTTLRYSGFDDSATASVSAATYDFISRVSQLAETEFGEKIVNQNLLGTYDVYECSKLILHNRVQSINSVKYRNSLNSDWIDITTDIEFTIGDYIIYSKTNKFPIGEKLVQVNYIGGLGNWNDIAQLIDERIRIIFKESNIKGGFSLNTLGENSRNADATLSFNTTFTDISHRLKELLDKKRYIV